MPELPMRAVVALLSLLSGHIARAQVPQQPQLEYRVAHIGAAAGGVYKHAADDWSILTLRLTNRHDHPVELLCISYFDVDPTLQYGRRVWLPGGSRMRTWYPIRIPPLPDPEQNRIEIHTMVSVAGGSPNELVRDDQGRLRISETLQIARPAPVAGVVTSLDAQAGARQPAVSPKDLLKIARLKLNLPPGSTAFGDRLLPAGVEGLQAFDHILLADDRILTDAAGLTALRQWLYDGGRLWVMLDRVGPDLLDSLLQDESGCRLVDTLTLTSVDVTPGPHINTHEQSTAEFEQPVKLVRVLLDEERVQYVVDGWPAAFTREYGAGRLLVTTLESAAWVTRPIDGASRPRAAASDQPVCTAPFLKLMEDFFAPPATAPAGARILETHVSDYIGYSIPARGLVVGLLGGFVLLLVVVGVILRQAGRLEWLAVAGPALAVLLAGGLMGTGRHHQQQVPPTRAMLQLVRPLPGTDHVDVEGAAGLYALDAGPLVLGGRAGGWMMPDFSGNSGTTRRLIRGDLDEWSWENVPRRPGLRTARLHVPVQRPPGVQAVASFGPGGLSGQITLPGNRRVFDAVIATQRGRIAVQVQADGRFTARADSVLGAGQYVDAELLNDEQVRRSRVLAELLTEQRIAADRAPVLCCWTDPWPAGLEHPAATESTGAALVAVPLTLERPPAGTRVRLPAPLLSYRGVTGPDGLRSSGLFDYRRNKWTRKLRPSSIWLRFQLPQELIPIELHAARITVRVTGPIGRLVLSIDRDNEVVPVKTWQDPIGTLELELLGQQLPQVDDAGGILLRIDGGDPDRLPPAVGVPDRSERATYWQIESLQLEVDALVEEAIERPAWRVPSRPAS